MLIVDKYYWLIIDILGLFIYLQTFMLEILYNRN